MAGDNVKNHPCKTCRRHCKQLSTSILIQCPRYYPGTGIKAENLKQGELWGEVVVAKTPRRPKKTD